MNISFTDFHLSAGILRAVEDMGFAEASPIQALAVPAILAGGDVIGQAQTGTGKTAAFALPILERLSPEVLRPEALILCPTRELAIQVAEEFARLAKYLKGVRILPVYGGQAFERQAGPLKQGVAVVVGTPGRLLDHLNRGTLNLAHIRTVVLDEADEMLNMGFRDDIETLLRVVPSDCQKVFFSATMPPAILKLSGRFLRAPAHLKAAPGITAGSGIEQTYFEVSGHRKMESLWRLMAAHDFRKALVFCATRRGADEMSEQLKSRGCQVEALHGELSQLQRDRVMKLFRRGRIKVLAATDVAARCLDVDDVEAVVNYDLPGDAANYVHRIGRTGRAGRPGRAFTFVTVKEQGKFNDIKRYVRARISLGALPSLKELAHIRTAGLLKEVRSAIDSGLPEHIVGLVDDFLEPGESGLVVAGALLKLVMERDFGSLALNPGRDSSAGRPPDRREPGLAGLPEGRKLSRGQGGRERPGHGRRPGLSFQNSGPGRKRFERSPADGL